MPGRIPAVTRAGKISPGVVREDAGMRSPRFAGLAYLAASGVGALNTLNAHRPLTFAGGGSVAAFAAGFVTSEVPGPALGIAVAETAAAVRGGALRTTPGKVGL